MKTIYPESHRLDLNLTVNFPEIKIKYEKHRRVNDKAWYITIDGEPVGGVSGAFSSRAYFKDINEAIDWLEKRDLLKTKAYDELDKRVNLHTRVI